MKFFAKIVSVVCCIAVVMTAVPVQMPAKAADKVYSIDTSDIDATAANITMTDAEFFAKLDLTSSDLSAVKAAVDSGDYTTAKKELLSYYQSKFSDSMPSYYSGVLEWMNYLAMNDAYAFTEEHLGNVIVPGNADGVFHDYYVDLGKSHANGVFVLSSLNKSEAALEIVSREHAKGAELGAELIFYKSGEAVKTLSVARDTFVRGGSYSDTIYGPQPYLNVKCDASSTLPYTENSRITYLYFDPSQIPSSSAYDNIKLKVHARSQKDDIKLEVFDAYNKSWAEYEGDDSGYLPMTWNNYKIAHYSWKNVAGGFDWSKPSNTATEWFNYNSRFYDQISLMRAAENNGFSAESTDKYGYTYAEYARKALAIMQDFANDAYGRITANTGVPKERDIESANRCMEFPALYARYVKLLDSSSDHDAQLNINMLKWLYAELTYLYNGAGIMYDGPTTTAKNTEIAYNNRGVWHVYGFLSSAFNFNEFANFGNWQTIAEARLKENMTKLILSDGAYGEATFNYPVMVINYWVYLAQLYQEKGIEYPENYIDKVSRVMKYLVDCTQSNGVTPNWGHGACQPRSAVKGWLATGLFTVENGVDPEVFAALESYAANTAPAYNDALYDDMRIAIARTGWTADDSMLFMNAKNGRSHSHKDSLAFTWYHNGGEVLTDTGMTSYDSGHPHFIFQQSSTDSHNTVEVDGTGQRNENQPQNDGESSISMVSNDGAAFIRGYTDANQHTDSIQVDHYRNVTYLKNLDMVISADKLVPLDGASHTYRQNWHTQTTTQRAVTADDTSKQAYTSYTHGRNIIVAQPAGDDSTVSVSKDGLDERFSDATHYMTFEKSGSGTVNYNTVLKAVDDDDQVSVTVTDKACDTNNTKLDITVTQNGVSDTYTHFSSFDDNTTRTFLGFTTDAASVTLSKDASGNMDYIALMGGGTLSSSGKTYFDFADATNVTVTKEGTTLNVYTDAAADNDFQFTGFGTDIETVIINGTSYKAMANGDTIRAYAGNLDWTYYEDKGLLHVYGEGDISGVDLSRYEAAQTLWLGKGVTIPDNTELSGFDKLTKVYLDAKYFDISWGTCCTVAAYKSIGYIEGSPHLPDTWAIRNQTIKSTHTIVPGTDVQYIPASATDTPAYNPTENTTAWEYACATPTATYDWEVDVINGKLTVSGGSLVAGSVRTGDFWPWHNARDIITSVYIDDTVPAVGKNSFSALDNVSDIRFSAAMTGFHMYMFDGNKALEKVIIPGNITTVSKYSFRNCTALTDVILCNGVAAIGKEAFAGSTNIQRIVIPADTSVDAESSIPTSAVRYDYDTLPVSGTVNGQSGLTWSYDKDADTLKFKGTGTLPAFPGNDFADNMWQARVNSSVIVIDGDIDVQHDAFRAGYDITKVYWNDNYMDYTYDVIANTGSWQDYPACFTLADGSVIPSANGKIVGCTVKDGWFEKDGIAAMPISGTYRTYNATEKDCSSAINTTYLSTVDWSYDTDAGRLTFTATDAADGSSVYIGNSVNNANLHYPWSYSGISSQAVAVQFDTTGDLKYTHIGKRAFGGFTKITDITLPATLTNLSMRSFDGCSALWYVDIPDSVVDISSYTFNGCSKLESITIPYGAATNETAFTGCSSLGKITCYASSDAAAKAFIKLKTDSNTTYHIKDIICYFDGSDVYYQSQTNITDAVLYIAGYDSSDNLQVVEKADRSTMTAGTVYSHTPEKISQLSQCDYFCIMLWYGDDMVPVCDVSIY